MKMVHDESFGIIPVRQEGTSWKVLLILHQGGKHWAFPKGHKDAGESAIEAAKRELKEETGLAVVSLLQEAPLMETYQFHRKYQLVTKKVSYFPAIVSGEIVVQAEEILEAKWLSFPEAMQQLTFKEARALLSQVKEILKAL